jgi:hypothetical protein
MPLPVAKTPATLTFERANTFLYGPPGIGKTTFATRFSPDDTLLAATEAGYGGIEAFVQPLNSWDDCKQLVKDLSGDHHFKLVAVDTVDVLATLCQADVMKRLKVDHPSDLEWGKGWEMVEKEFQLVIAPLMQHPDLGVVFIGHADEREIKRSAVLGGPISVFSPSVGPKSIRKFLTGTCDFVFFAEARDQENGDGPERIVHTVPGESWVAKQRDIPGRPPLPEILPLDAVAIAAAIKGDNNDGKETPDG